VSAIAIERVRGAAVARHLDDLARLRIAVFREYPYLYEGSLDYERRYLQHYADAPASVVVLAKDAGQIVGAATAMPLDAHDQQLVPLFGAHGFAPEQVFYFGESVLAPSHRGRGVGHAFFDAREAEARAGGFAVAAFCAVVRDPQHPRRPAGYVPHDAFWSRRGYAPRPGMEARFSWRDLDEPSESPKVMQFWLKSLAD
jgi:GNAT superfamily N-acetyltransferase